MEEAQLSPHKARAHEGSVDRHPSDNSSTTTIARQEDAATTDPQQLSAATSSVQHDTAASTSSTTSSSSGGSETPVGWSVMLDLPPDILVRHILAPYLSVRDLQAARQVNSLFRQLANAAVSCCVLDAYSQDNQQAAQQIPASFVNLQQLRIICTPPAAAAAKSNTSTGSSSSSSSSASSSTGVSSSSSRLEHLQEQLPLLTGKLPSLCHLVYEGPRDRRQQGLNMTPALKALTRLATAHTPTTVVQSSTTAAVEQPGCHALHQQGEQQPSQPQQQQLRVLELTAGSLPDSLMEAVGKLTGLACLKLTATAAIHMAPVAQLTALTAVTLTVTPPLPSALAPLARCTRLAQLQLSALSPARGWGRALALLKPCSGTLSHLVLTFADVCDEDMLHMAAALTGLRHLNLNYSRHLTPGAIPHLASTLPHLEHLHLLETGLTLHSEELVTLSRGCKQLVTLEAAFDLRGVGPVAAAGDAVSGAAAAAATATAAAAAGSNACSSSSSCTNSSCRGWPNLHNIILNGVSAADFQKLLAGFAELHSITLNNIGLNGEQIVGQHLVCGGGHHHHHHTTPQHLTALSLSQASAFSAAACAALGTRLPHLKALTLTDIAQQPATLAHMLGLLGTHAALESLTLRRCQWVDDAVLTHGVAKLGRSLRQLEVLGCEQVTGGGVLALADRLLVLVRLVVRDCPLVVQQGTAWAWERRVAAANAAAAGGGGDGRDSDIGASVSEKGSSCLVWPWRQQVVIDGGEGSQL